MQIQKLAEYISQIPDGTSEIFHLETDTMHKWISAAGEIRIMMQRDLHSADCFIPYGADYVVAKYIRLSMINSVPQIGFAHEDCYRDGSYASPVYHTDQEFIDLFLSEDAEMDIDGLSGLI